MVKHDELLLYAKAYWLYAHCETAKAVTEAVGEEITENRQCCARVKVRAVTKKKSCRLITFNILYMLEYCRII